ncbi:hypothetical protein ACIQVR_39540 [Streptomyces xanthochromogenes]|uniref:hypothetical protein n=1 Tax=Streptomyces xanthochromogenes TaxID=67384 RepID=UPI003800DEC0
MSALRSLADGARVTASGTITVVVPQVTGQGVPWAIAELGEGDAMVPCYVWPAVYGRHRELLAVGRQVRVTGRLSDYRGLRRLEAHHLDEGEA